MKTILSPIRRATQFFGLLVANVYISVIFRNEIYKGPFKGICFPVLYCHACPSSTFSCPIGTVQHYMTIQKIPFFLLGHLALLALLIGRMTCGWLCPFGLLQDLCARLTMRKISIPRAFGAARHVRYAVILVLVLLIPWLTSEHWFSKLCPCGTLVAGIPWVAWNPTNPGSGGPTVAAGSVGILFVIKLIILAGFLFLFVAVKRPFCRFVCPLGLCLSFFNRTSVLRLEVAGGCNECGICQKNCPMDNKVYEDPNSPNCIRCLKCTACKHVTVVAPMLGLRGTATKGEPLLEGSA